MRRPDLAGAKRAGLWARRRLQAARYFVADVGYVIGRSARRLAAPPARVFNRLPATARRGLAVVLAALAVLLVLIGVAVPNLPCSFPGGDTCPPSDDAERLVPADALAYLHVNLDPDTDQYEQAARIAGDLPLFSGQLTERALAQVPGPRGGRVDFDRDLGPWFGGEAALAVLGHRGGAQRALLFEAADEQGAREFADSIGGLSAVSDDYDGVEISVDRRGIASAVVEGFLVLGTRDGVREITDAATGTRGAGALADDETATEVRDQLPDERLADVYLSRDGVRRLVAGSRGALAALSPLLAPSATLGAGAALVATDAGLELTARSALDPSGAESSPGFLAAFPRFQPTLAARLAPKTLAYIGIGEPRTAIARLAVRASSASGVVAGLGALVEGLSATGSRRGLAELAGLGDEAALALVPRAARLGEALPYLEFVTGGVDEGAARSALATFSGGSADRRQLAGVEANTVRLSPAIEVTYAVFDGIAALAGNPEGIEALAAGDGGLDESARYERATAGFGDEASLIAFVDIGGLVAIGERLGLGEDPVYATFAGEFRRLRALAVRVDRGADLLATDARLLVSDRGPPAGG